MTPADAWLPIESAPRDGTRVLVYRPGYDVAVVRWDSDRYAKRPRPLWEDDRAYLGRTWCRETPPTHWQPLPAPPRDGDG